MEVIIPLSKFITLVKLSGCQHIVNFSRDGLFITLNQYNMSVYIALPCLRACSSKTGICGDRFVHYQEYWHRDLERHLGPIFRVIIGRCLEIDD